MFAFGWIQITDTNNHIFAGVFLYNVYSSIHEDCDIIDATRNNSDVILLLWGCGATVWVVGRYHLPNIHAEAF